MKTMLLTEINATLSKREAVTNLGPIKSAITVCFKL